MTVDLRADRLESIPHREWAQKVFQGTDSTEWEMFETECGIKMPGLFGLT